MRLSRPIGIVFAAAATGATCAWAASGGPAPGVLQGFRGVSDGSDRYITVPVGKRTLVQAVKVRGGAVTRFRAIPGNWGVPLIANDGSTGGLSHDGSRLVLQSAAPGAETKFAVLDTNSLRSVHTIRLKGAWSFDALSPDAETLYLIQHVATRNANSSRYYVRAYDLIEGRLAKKIVFDTREKWGLMSGVPVTRATSRTGRWVYTLYTRSGGSPFVHALDASNRRAVCIDLPWRGSQSRIWGMKLKLKPGKLVVGARAAVIDTKTFRVTS
jgi:hypothetical protein